MNDLETIRSYPAMPAMGAQDIEKARAIESQLAKFRQMELKTLHVIHAGVYSRTVVVPAGHMITGVLIKIPTQVIVSGSATVFVGDKVLSISGYNVLPAQANRKQVFLAITDIYITMLFSSSAKTVEEAEAEFTDEIESLMSHKDESQNIFIKSEE